MRPISKIIICCGFVLAVMQSAIAAGTTAPSASVKPKAYQAIKKPTMAQVQKRLEDRGIMAKKRRALARKKALERQNATPAIGK